MDPIYWTPDKRSSYLTEKDKILQIRPPAALSDVMPLRNMLGRKKACYFINEKGRCVFGFRLKRLRAHLGSKTQRCNF